MLAVTDDDMFRWKEHCIEFKIDHGTICRIDLTVPRSIFGWEVKDKRHMPSNPANHHVQA